MKRDDPNRFSGTGLLSLISSQILYGSLSVVVRALAKPSGDGGKCIISSLLLS